MRGTHLYKRKKTRALLAVSLLVIALSIGITFAYMFQKTTPKDNTFERAVVHCEVEETFNETTGIKSSIRVKNTGNIPAHIRVRLVSYWVNQDGDICAKEASVPSFTPGSGWTAKGDNIYQCNTEIAVNGYTPELLGGSMTLQKDGEYRQVVEVFAEAIQSNAIGMWEAP